MAGAHVQFKADPELLRRIDDEAEAHGYSRSDMIRQLLAMALGDSAQMTAARAVVWQVQAKLRNKAFMEGLLEYVGDYLETEDLSHDARGNGGSGRGRRTSTRG